MAENDVKKYIDYIWISKFRGIENQGFQFTCKYTYDYDDETKKLTRKKNEEYPNYIDNFFGERIEINAVIGKNGCGKTSLMQAIYEFFNCQKIRFDEKMLFVLSDGSVYTKKRDSFKITVYNEELPIDWDNGSDELFSDIQCIYHTNVLDFQSVDFCSCNSDIDTNISLTSLLVDHSLTNISEDQDIYNGDVSRLLKEFFYREFGRQITLFEKTVKQNDNKLGVKFPKYVYITPKSLDSIKSDLERMFVFSNVQLFMNEHASNLFHVKCRIPEQKEELLEYIRKFMEESDEKELRRYRERITRVF